MINKIKSLFKNQSFLTLFSNFSYLSVIQVLGILFPLFTYPYIIRVLGAEIYGMIALAQAIIAYLVILINFGFNVSAVRRVSENRSDLLFINRLYTSITLLKFFIFCISLLSLLLVYFICDDVKIIYIMIASMGMCLSEVFYPIWLFQGLEQMKFITIISFLSQVVYLVLVFVLVHNADDYLMVPIATSVCGLLNSFASILILFKRGITFVSVPFKRLKTDFMESLPFFASRLSAVVMERSNVLLIGAFFDYSMVSAYDICTKVVKIFTTPFSLVAQVLYPHVAKNKNMGIVMKTYKVVILSGIFISLTCVIFAPFIVSILSGNQLGQAVPVLRYMIWYVPIVGMSYVMGSSTLVVNGYVKEYNLSVIYSFLVYCLLIIFFWSFNEVNMFTMATAFLVPELFTALYRRYISYKRGIFNNSF